MKPNDKAIEAALLAAKTVLRNNEITIDSAIFAAVTAAYAAQFQSEDYAELLRKARIKATMLLMCEPIEFGSDSAIINNLSDAIEALLAERDALKAELAAANTRMSKLDFERTAAELDRDAIRDALAARLAPVDDDALVEIAAEAISTYVPDQVSKWGSIKDAAIDAIAAIRPHIEAAERERCAKIADKYEGEWHSDTADACARAIAAAIRRGSGK